MNLVLTKFVNKFWVSRSKTLLKRRRKHIKSRAISDKKLEQQAKHFNYARQYRALQIKKQLDKVSYSSQHINQLMDQIFYPDVTLANEQAAKIQMEVSLLKQYNIEDIQQDQYSTQMKKIVLATQLINFYLLHKDQLEIFHFLTLTKKLGSYFENKEKIKEKTLKKWERINQNLKKSDPKYKTKKCPYIFLEKQDLIHYEPWIKCIQHIKSQIKNVIQQDILSIQHIETLLLFSEIIQQINKALNYIPFTLYNTFQKYLQKLREQQISSLDLDASYNILQTISIKKSVVFPIHNVISDKIEKQESVALNKQKIVLRILSDSDVKVSHLESIITCIEKQQVALSGQISKLIKPIILANLSELNFDKCVQLLNIYTTKTKGQDIQLIELIKFDTLRKCQHMGIKANLFKCMDMVNNRYIRFPNNTSQIYGYDLFHQCAKTLSTIYCGRNLLQYSQVLKIINLYYTNRLNDINLLELLANQLVKLRDQLSLTQITEAVFMVYLLGYHSPVLSRVLIEEHKKRYHEAIKRVKNKQVPLLTGMVSDKIGLFSQQDKIDRQQIQLQQNLIISIWLLFLNSEQFWRREQIFPISTDELMKIYPLATSSKHPLIYEICQNLNYIAKSKSMLWKIKCVSPDQNYNSGVINRLDKYYDKYPSSLLERTLKIESQESQRFLFNWNRTDKKYLTEKWSKYNTYNLSQYKEYIRKQQNKNTNYFNQTKQPSQNLKQLRDQVIKQQKNNKQRQKQNLRNQVQDQEQQLQMYRLD